jgi:hypothetical protein
LTDQPVNQFPVIFCENIEYSPLANIDWLCEYLIMSEQTEKIPKRGRWTKRICVVLVVYTAATIAGRLWWGRHADNLLRAELDAIHARGEIIEWSDLASKPIPDDENAAELYKKAFESPLLRDYYDKDDDSLFRRRSSNMPPNLERLKSMISPLVDYPDFRREHKKDVREILKLSADALALCRQARGLEKVDWKMDFTGPALELALPIMSKHKDCARLLCLAALDAHDAGDDAKAVEYIRDAIALADAIENMPVLVSHLVAVAINSLAWGTIEQITPSLRIGDDDRSASAKQVRLLIDDLLDEQALQRGLFLAFTAERAMWYDMTGRIKDYLSEFTLNFVASPTLTLSKVRMLRFHKGYIAAAAQEDYPKAKRKMPLMTGEADTDWVFSEGDTLRKIAHLLDLVTMPSCDNTFVVHFSCASMRRMTAVALAIRLYELDHSRRPGKLDELAGEGKYLDAIPADPFAKDGLPMLYAPKAETPLLYSVGANGRDDGGNEEFSQNEEGFHEKWDILFFLNGDRAVGECIWTELAPQPVQRGDGRRELRRRSRSAGPRRSLR